MKHFPLEVVVQRGEFVWSKEWRTIKADLEASVESIVWPPGAANFTINPTRQGNGVRAMCSAFKQGLKARGTGWELEWMSEAGLGTEVLAGVGDFDAAFPVGKRHFVVEWETGNISSTHRSLNRIALGIIRGGIIGGAVVISSRAIYRYLTDRIGNIDEIRPYYAVYDRLHITDGLIAMLTVEHDAESSDVPLMEKTNDGMSKKPR